MVPTFITEGYDEANVIADSGNQGRNTGSGKIGSPLL